MLNLLLRWFGPVFAKEMVEVARRRRYYLNRILYGAALLIAVWIAWEEYGHYYYRNQSTIQQAARMAHGLFLTISFVQYGAVWLLVPVLLCATIAGEREAHTLDLLLTTKLNDREIVLGKLASRLVVFGAFVASGVPVVCLTMLFGGVDVGAVWGVQAATLLAALFAAGHAMYFSTTTRSPLGALVRTYFWMALWLLGLPLVSVMIVEVFNVRPNDPAAIIVWAQVFINPIAAFIASIEPSFRKEIERHIGGWVVPTIYVLPTTWSVWLFWRAVRKLRRTPVAGRLASWVAAVTRELGRAGRFFDSLARSGRPLSDGANPLLVRAMRARVYDREQHMFRVQLAGAAFAWGLAIFLMLASPRDLFDDEVAMVYMSCTWIGVGLLAIVTGAGSLVGDRRRGFLDQVLVTPLAAREIVDGTLRAVWRHLRVGVWLALSLTALFVFSGTVNPLGAAAALVSALLCLYVLIITGVAVSLAARNVAAALVATLALPLSIGLGTIPLIIIFEEASGPVTWVLTLVALPATWLWARRSGSTAAAGSFLIALHFALVGLAEFWTIEPHSEELPLLAMNGGVWAILPLDSHFMRTFGPRDANPLAMLLCYWPALGANIVLARGWLVRNFDRLAGRVDADAYRASASIWSAT